MTPDTTRLVPRFDRCDLFDEEGNTRPPVYGPIDRQGLGKANDVKFLELLCEEQPDGRFGWPAIFGYRWGDNCEGFRVTACRPPLGMPYRIIVKQRALYDQLVALGFVYAPEHTGRRQAEIVDERKAPGA